MRAARGYIVCFFGVRIYGFEQVTDKMLKGQSCLDAGEAGVQYDPLTDIALAVRSCGMLAGAIGRIWGPRALPRVFAWLGDATARVLSGVRTVGDVVAGGGGGGGVVVGGGGDGGGGGGGDGDEADGVISLVPAAVFGGRTKLAVQRAECLTALAAIVGHMSDTDLTDNVNIVDMLATTTQVGSARSSHCLSSQPHELCAGMRCGVRV